MFPRVFFADAGIPIFLESIFLLGVPNLRSICSKKRASMSRYLLLLWSVWEPPNRHCGAQFRLAASKTLPLPAPIAISRAPIFSASAGPTNSVKQVNPEPRHFPLRCRELICNASSAAEKPGQEIALLFWSVRALQVKAFSHNRKWCRDWTYPRNFCRSKWNRPVRPPVDLCQARMLHSRARAQSDPFLVFYLVLKFRAMMGGSVLLGLG